MSYVQFDDKWEYNGCRVLRLESDLLRLDVFPELGGKILNWIHKPEDRNWLWTNPRVKPAILPQHSRYDDNWSGGWDELFPTCSPCDCEGETYPDHGEYWTLPCTYSADIGRNEITLYTCAEGRARPTRLERWITLTAGSLAVKIGYRLTHLGLHGFHYLWGFHPGFAVRPGCQLVIPAGKGIIASPGTGRLGDEGAAFTWPNVPGRQGRTVDFSKIPEPTPEGGYEMVYLTEMLGGYFAVHDPATQSGFGLALDHKLFDSFWVFATFGGWRGLNVVNIEPATGYPGAVADALKIGRCRYLEPGQVIETECVGVVYAGKSQVTAIDRDGTVR